MSLEKKLTFMQRWAHLIDGVDMFTGPASVATYHSGSETLEKMGRVANLAELIVLKVPFMVAYVAKTRDYKSVGLMVLKEIVNNTSPNAALLDLFPMYSFLVDRQEKKAYV